MSKSSPRRAFGRKGAGTITVLEARVHHSSRRNARLAFYLTLVTVGLLTATITADRDQTHPILALFLGAIIGVIAGAIVWALVRIWPVLRLLWWWTPEIGLALTVVYGWTALVRHTPTLVTLGVVALLVGVPTAIAPVRRWLAAWIWCLIVRHRLRVCFAEFIIANQSGTLPLILWAHPTPVGERVWIYLRPGLALTDLNTEGRLDKIAVTCHASAVVIERASETTAAYLRIDIKRREVLTATIESPLVGLVDPDTPTIPRAIVAPPTALDLPDITADTVNGKPARTDSRKPAATAESKPADTGKPASANGGKIGRAHV